MHVKLSGEMTKHRSVRRHIQIAGKEKQRKGADEDRSMLQRFVEKNTTLFLWVAGLVNHTPLHLHALKLIF
ncbi:uncharacterized [Tachysurus ichikawai]